jgi:hypothetical protein
MLALEDEKDERERRRPARLDDEAGDRNLGHPPDLSRSSPSFPACRQTRLCAF